MQLFRQKGVSPLIATVLILGFTVVLVGLMMTWSQRFTRQLTEEADQSQLELQGCVRELGFDIRSACYDSNSIRFQLENIGARPIVSAHGRVYYADADPESVTAEDILGSFPLIQTGIESYSVTYSPGKTPTSFEFIPAISIQGRNITCAAQGLIKIIGSCA